MRNRSKLWLYAIAALSSKGGRSYSIARLNLRCVKLMGGWMDG